MPASPTATFGTPVAQLDVETVVKASQAVSGEIVLSKLIETLMRITIEHAGAERGLLILFHSGEPWIEAEAKTGSGTVEVALRQAKVTPSELPEIRPPLCDADARERDPGRCCRAEPCSRPMRMCSSGGPGPCSASLW